MLEQANTEPTNGLRPGSEVGGYRIGSRLGSGAMGAVYSAYDGGGTLVAVKFLHAHLDVDARGRERLRREASALQRLRHPAVAQILDVEFDGPEAFIVTELVDGPTLEEEIAHRGPLDAWDLYELADQLAAALEAVHQAGVVHRDLKPSNILVAERGPVIIDFGIAHGLDDPRVTATGLVMGTPGYLPPELLDGARPNPDTDWWGWAALLAYAATGRAPFGVRPMEAVLSRSRSGLPDLGGLGPTTASALAGALRAEPGRRWGPTRVVAELRRAADEGDVPAPTIVVGPPTSPTEAVPPVVVPMIPVTQSAVHDGRTMAMPADVPAGPPPPAFPPSGARPAAERFPGAPPGVAPASLAPPHPAPAGPVPAGPVPAGPAAAGFVPAGAGAGAGAGQGQGHVPVPAAPAGPYRRPVRAKRTAVLLAIAVPTVLAACLYPVAAIGAYAALVFAARIVGVTADTWHNRRERRGVSKGDFLRSAVALPWYVLRALLGTIPSILVGSCAGMLVVVGGWWLLGPGGLTGARAWAEPLILVVAASGAVAMAWAGPLTYLTRDGTRATLDAVAPGPVGGTVVAVLSVAAAFIVIWMIVQGESMIWWPLPGPPQF